MRSIAWRKHNLGSALTLGIGALGGAPSLAQVANNPGYDRPGLGFTPAVLQPGDFTLEQGLPDWSRNDGITSYDADTLVRLGIGHALELQLGTGWSRLQGSGPDSDGRSSTVLAVKFAPSTESDVSWGLVGSVEFTDGSEEFRADQEQYLVGSIISWQTSAEHALGLYVEAMDGDTDSRLLAVHGSWAPTATHGLYVELAAQHLDGLGNGSMGGAGLTWQATPRVHLDISFRHRLSGHADTWQGGVGFSVYFGE